MVGFSNGHQAGGVAKRLSRAVQSVIDTLESRRLLSADGVDETLPVDETLSEEAVYYTLTSVSEEAGDGEVSEEVVDGEVIDKGEEEGVPEEWIYRTMVGEEGSEEDGEVVDEEPVYKGEEGEVGEDGEVIYTLESGVDGEVTTTSEEEEIDPRVVLMPDGGEGEDLDGDGVPDIIYYTLADGAPANAILKKNGTLTVNGTDGDDTIGLTLEGTKIVVTVNGDKLGSFEKSVVEKIKVSGGKGNDTITVADGIKVDAKLKGEDGDDDIKGGSGDDKITGGKGNDKLDGKKGDDRMSGGKGKDDMRGGKGTDDMKGGKGVDKMRGGKESDGIRGGNGLDKIWGGDGDDFLDGGESADRIMGGEGTDGVMDPNDDVLEDIDAEDTEFASIRLAAPGWWTEDDNTSGAMCMPEFPDCDDMVVDEMPDSMLMPIWWQPGDSDPVDTGEEPTDAGDAARIDPSQFPDGNYPDDTPGSDEEEEMM